MDTNRAVDEDGNKITDKQKCDLFCHFRGTKEKYLIHPNGRPSFLILHAVVLVPSSSLRLIGKASERGSGFQFKMFSLSHNRTQNGRQENKRSDHQQENLCRSALGDV